MTGTIAEKESLHFKKYPALFNRAGFLWDRVFTPPEPVWAWLVVHPEGIFLIDTGLSPEINDRSYLGRAGFLSGWFLRTQFRYEMEKHQQLGNLLDAAGYKPADIKMVILTHLHFDHTGNLKLFPTTPILLHKAEWLNPFSAVESLHPVWFKPELLLFGSREPAADTLMEGAFPITEAADLLLVNTPGHTYGHISVLLKTDDRCFLFAGDITGTQQELIEGKFAPGSANRYKLRLSRWKILDFASRHPLVYLPSHDPQAGVRLLAQTVIPR